MLGQWPLTGRGEELDFCLAALRGGTQSGLVLAGGAGVGKTRLAREITAAADGADMTTITAAATAAAAAIPFGALAHLVPRATGPRSRLDLFHEAADAIAGQGRGNRTVLAVDDAHQLDEGSAALVHHLAVSGQAFVLLTVRTGAPAPDPVVALWKDGLAARLEVQPLSQPEVAALLAAGLDGQVEGSTVHRLWATSGGNLLFLRELVGSGLDAGALAREGGIWRWHGPVEPGRNLVDLVEARLAGLTPPEREGLEVLAVAEPIGAQVIAEVIATDVLESLERVGLAEPDNDHRRVGLRLSHPLFGEVLRARMPVLTAQRVRRLLADGLEATGMRRRDDLLRAASWRLAAGGDAGGADMLLAAARSARSLSAHALEERLVRAAIAAGAPVDAMLDLATAQYWQGEYAESAATLRSIERAELSDEARARLSVELASALYWGLADTEGALAELDEARRALPHGSPQWEVEAHGSSISLFAGSVTEARADAEEVLGAAPPDDRAVARAVVVAVAAQAMAGATNTAWATAMQHLGAVARWAAEVPLAAGQLMIGQAFAHWLGGRLDQANAIAESVHGVAVARLDDDARGAWTYALGRVALTRGDVAGATAWLREGGVLLADQDVAGFRPGCLGALAQALGQAGDGAGASRVTAEARATHRGVVKLFDADIALGEAWAAMASREVSTARDLALAAASEAGRRGQFILEAMALHEVVRFGAPAAVSVRLAELAESMESALVRAWADHAMALADGDGRGLDVVAESLSGIGAALIAAECAAEAATSHLASGRLGAAEASFATAVRLAESCPGADTARFLRRDLTGDPLAVLTDREREIASLAGEGLTSREIATRLFVSVRTVDNHLARCYEKLGVRNRKELAGLTS